MLSELITEYFTNKTELDRIKKTTDKLNSQIKEKMLEGNLDKFDTGTSVAMLGKQERVTVNQDKLLQKLKDMKIDKPIKTIEVLDESILEDMVYSGELDASIVAECTETKNIYVLKVKKKRG